MKTILVPVDLSAATTRVCDAARDFARLMHARLVLVHVVLPQPILPGDFFAFDASVVAAATLAAEERADRRLRALVDRYRTRSVAVRAVRRSGQPAGEILSESVDSKADYIVMGSHGHGAAYDLLIGSATQGVLRRAPCPVLVVPIKRR